MPSPALEHLHQYLLHPMGTLQLRGIQVGNLRIEELNITGREAAIHAQEMLDRADDRQRRSRRANGCTQYPVPLPVASAPRLLSVEIADYIRSRDDRGLAKDTTGSTFRTLTLLKMACGDIPVSRIDHAHIYRLWELLRWAPPLLLSDPKYRDYTYEEAVALGKELAVPPLAPKTLEKHRRFLSTFFKGLVEANAIPASPMAPFKKFKEDLAEDADKAERLFDESDLQRIFAPETFVPWAKSHPHRWWMPMIGLYTGARINEVAQLKVADIVQEAGMWWLRIRVTIDPDLAHKSRGRSRQRLKGRSAIRDVPIAKQLIDAGFLDFVEDIRQCGHPRLFPHLSAGVNRKTGDSNARYSQAALNQFSTYMKRLGFRKGVGFHAFRHTIATELHHQDIPEEVIALITGHSPNKRVAVLHEAYFHKKPALAQKKKIRTIKRYQPIVELPKYQRGQFTEQLSDPSKFYP
ncbi:site-specific integrase [Stenotrophomonas maltophilia]|uniref:site-specific integrase n=1 Tax=Stenotrophomonas maltophilia TaxID=40324 RepID=UPI001F53C94C|nr:site-specific integrase [Stenotrophomonas maltophilia]MCI1130809.1 site-specific integrase [Stenotrophomonas maltophilia]